MNLDVPCILATLLLFVDQIRGNCFSDAYNDVPVILGNNSPQESYTCGFTGTVLVCPVGQKIQIGFVDYGRIGVSICREQENTDINEIIVCTWTTNVPNWVYNPSDDINQKCYNQNYCFVNADYTRYGDPCVGIPKYLTVTFQCN